MSRSGSLPAAESILPTLDSAWATDGLTRLGHRWTPERVQITFESTPLIPPTIVAARAKGRLDHALRKSGWVTGFSRRVSIRSLGANTADQVLGYIATQLDRAELADPRYAATLARAAWDNPAFDLSEPLPTGHGRYWYDLHLVAVTEGRFRMGREDFLDRIRTAALRWGESLAEPSEDADPRPGLRSLALMPDHLHLAARGPINRPPAELSESLWRELNRAAGCRLFSDRIYVGTVSDYSLEAIGLALRRP